MASLVQASTGQAILAALVPNWRQRCERDVAAELMAAAGEALTLLSASAGAAESVGCIPHSIKATILSTSLDDLSAALLDVAADNLPSSDDLQRKVNETYRDEYPAEYYREQREALP